MPRSIPSLGAMDALLDAFLDLAPAEQAAWLARLRRDQPELAPELEALLAAEWDLDQRRFLEHGPAHAVAGSPTLAGHSAGPYVLDRLLGDGGMGSVWLARHGARAADDPVAVKLLNLELLTPVGSARFRREGQALSRLEHRGISRLLDTGVTEGGQPYLVLEFVDGDPIDRYCDAHRLPAAARIALVLQVVAALDHAHANHIIHRDIKPSNILVTAKGQAMLLDFGIAKLLNTDPASPDGTGISKTGGLPFTPDYAAPEQVKGGDITAATDVYALGVLLFQLLGGRHPTGPQARSTAQHIRGLLRVSPPRLSKALRHDADDGLGVSLDELREHFARGLDGVLARALEKGPELRYQSVAALGADLVRWT
ncbi:MAG TPA: serine/threonine-protein kinase [Gemmatimonadales bacterium]|nr:serine/threonine-protein kinase [Gemmatimonadales bacterium]